MDDEKDEKTSDLVSMVKDESLFTLVKDFQKFKNVLTTHVANQGQVLLRNANDDQFFSKTIAVNANNCLECYPPLSNLGDCLPSYLNKNILVDFFSEGERFHFQTISSVIPKHPQKPRLALPIPNKHIFQRQRRTEFRYILPNDYAGEFILKNYSGKIFTGRIIDISNMGVSILWNKDLPQLKNEELLTGQLKLGKDKDLSIKGIVCFLKATGSTLRVGIEFTEVDANSLLALSERIIKLQNFVFEKK